MGGVFSCFNHRMNDNETINNNNNKSAADQETVEVDLSNYMYQGLEKEVVGKTPGQLNGEDFIIDNCKDSSIYILDHSAAVTIDDCTDDVIFIAPCKGSVFIRDCVRCVIMASCQQFRARDCTQCTVYLHCTTQPVIEASSGMKFGCFQCHYPKLRDQFRGTGLSIFNNNWYSIHNFTPQIEDSWSLIRKGNDDMSVFSPSVDSDLDDVQLTFDPSSSVVPYTHGHNNSPLDLETCLVVFMNTDDVESLAINCTQQLLKSRIKNDLIIAQTKDITLEKPCSPEVTEFFSGSRSLSSGTTPQGHVIFMEVCGEDCISICTSVFTQLTSTDLVYWSPDKDQGTLDVHDFHELVEQNFRL